MADYECSVVSPNGHAGVGCAACRLCCCDDVAARGSAEVPGMRRCGCAKVEPVVLDTGAGLCIMACGGMDPCGAVDRTRRLSRLGASSAWSYTLLEPGRMP